jgi:hypothetical protein
MDRHVSARIACFLSPCALLAAHAHADQITVPGDQPDLQAAIDAAAPGDVIVVQTSTPQDGVVVDKPLIVVGDPLAEVLIGPGCGARGQAAFELLGPGAGTLVLVNVRTSPGADCFQPAPAIRGGGFDELHLFECEILPAADGQTGLGHGAPGISVSVGFVLLASSTVVGGTADSDHCAGFLLGDGEPGIEAPASTVVVLDSMVSGGGPGTLCCQFCACPPNLSGLGGVGGEGLLAAELYVANSSIEGGAGATHRAYPLDEASGGAVVCGTQPSGTPFVVGSFVLLAPGDLTGPARMQVGSTWTLSWSTPSALNAFYWSIGSVPPYPVGTGLGFLDPASARRAGTVPGGMHALNLAVPNLPGLIGLELAFQLVDPASGPTRPVIAVIAP